MLKALSNKVFIQAIGDPDKTEGGLYIPDEAKERSRQGIVQYVGPKCEEVKPGDYVFFNPYEGETVQIKDEGTFIVMPDDRLSGIIHMHNIPLDLYVREKIPRDLMNGELYEYHQINYEYLMRYLAEVFKQTSLARGLSSLSRENRNDAERTDALQK